MRQEAGYFAVLHDDDSNPQISNNFLFKTAPFLLQERIYITLNKATQETYSKRSANNFKYTFSKHWDISKSVKRYNKRCQQEHSLTNQHSRVSSLPLVIATGLQ